MFLSFCVWMIFSLFKIFLVFGYSWSTLLWYRCYYPHWSRDSLSPVCGIFKRAVKSIYVATQLYGQSRQGGHGICQGFSMGSGTPTTPKRFKSPFHQHLFCIKKSQSQFFPIYLRCPKWLNKSYNKNQ